MLWIVGRGCCAGVIARVLPCSGRWLFRAMRYMRLIFPVMCIALSERLIRTNGTEAENPLNSGCPKAPPARREGSSVRFVANKKVRQTTDWDFAQSVVAFLYSISLFIACPARAASACSRRSTDWVFPSTAVVRWYSVLPCLDVSVLHSECPKTPPARRAGSSVRIFAILVVR